MITGVTEASYPIEFRKADATRLGEHLRHRRSVVLIGMKRVGISNFLRFFLFHNDVVQTYISPDEAHLFIPVDLNDLVEREIYPFWVLTFKRFLDFSLRAALPVAIKKQLEHLFSNSIQSQDLFLVIDGLRQAMRLVSNASIRPTLFFLRFDRMKDVVTPSFFDNLQGLKDATNGELAYVFTSYRSLDVLAPKVFAKTAVSVFVQPIALKPAKGEDMQVIYATYRAKFHVPLTVRLEKSLFALVRGYVQYLQLALLILHEHGQEVCTEDELFTLLASDERITLQSEELWESLTHGEQGVLMRIMRGEAVSAADTATAKYLWDTGFVIAVNGRPAPFSKPFTHYLLNIGEQDRMEGKNAHFTRKEQLLVDILLEHKNEVCDRDAIITAVWPEYEELGGSDWAVDRLVSRVRSKLKQQGSKQEIITVRTRGYKITVPEQPSS